MSATDSNRLERGTRLLDRYVLLERVGEGGSGVVWRAQDDELGCEVALKLIRAESTARQRGRFDREVRVLQKMSHRHTVRVLDHGTLSNGREYLATEFIDGASLSGIGIVDESSTIVFLTQLLDALQHAHDLGVLHRDVKPANILLATERSEGIKLIDFGIAKVTTADSRTALTKTGVVVGTQTWMPPEQLFAEPVSPSTDIYAAGLIGMFLLGGLQTVQQWQNGTIAYVLEANPDPPRLVESLASARFRSLLERMASSSPTDRFSTAAEAARAISRLGSQEETNELGMSGLTTREVAKPQGRAKWVIPAFAALFAVLAMFVVNDPPPAEDHSVAGRPVTAPVAAPAPPQRPTDETEVSPQAPPAIDELADTERSAGCEGPAPDDVFRPGSRTAVRLPESYDHSVPAPLLVLIPARGVSPSETLQRSGWDRVVDEVGLIVAIPHLSEFGKRWNRDDSSWIVGDVRKAIGTACVDLRRVFTMGHLGGADIVLELPCLMPGEIRAMSVHGKRNIGARCFPEAAVPRIDFVGMLERHNPVDDSPDCQGRTQGRITLDVFADFWRRRHDCSDGRERYVDEPAAECFRYECETPFRICELNGGRGWPFSRAVEDEITRTLGLSEGVCSVASSSFEVARQAWSFFDEVSRNVK